MKTFWILLLVFCALNLFAQTKAERDSAKSNAIRLLIQKQRPVLSRVRDSAYFRDARKNATHRLIADSTMRIK